MMRMMRQPTSLTIGHGVGKGNAVTASENGANVNGEAGKMTTWDNRNDGLHISQTCANLTR